MFVNLQVSVTSLILDTFSGPNSLLTFWLFELFLPLFITIISNLNCFCPYFKHYHIFLDTQCQALLLHVVGYCCFFPLHWVLLVSLHSAVSTTGFLHWIAAACSVWATVFLMQLHQLHSLNRLVYVSDGESGNKYMCT